MKIKLLRRLCADEVKLMLERMDSNFEEEFAINDSKWEPLLPHGDGFRLLTGVEQHCIRSEYMAHREKYKKAQAYQEILERAMSPAKTRWEYRESKEAGVQTERARSSKVLTTAAMASQAQKVLEQEYQKAYQYIPPQPSTMLDQKINYEAESLAKQMIDVRFELRNARSLDEVRMIQTKYEATVDLEKHIIEHQEFLRKHAPRGYC